MWEEKLPDDYVVVNDEYHCSETNFRNIDAKIAYFNEQLSKFPIIRTIIDDVHAFSNFDYLYESNAIESETTSVKFVNVPSYLKNKAPDIVYQFIARQYIEGKPLRLQAKKSPHELALNIVTETAENERKQSPLPPVSDGMIRNIHYFLLNEYETNAGRYRTRRVVVNKASWTPPNPIKVEKLMEGLMKQLNNDWAHDHPIVQAAKLHTSLIRIHPFDDGNGRTCRLMVNYILMRNGYPSITIKSNDKEAYYKVLDDAIQTGDVSKVAGLIVRGLNERYSQYVKTYNNYIKKPEERSASVILPKGLPKILTYKRPLLLKAPRPEDYPELLANPAEEAIKNPADATGPNTNKENPIAPAADPNLRKK